MLKLKNYSGHIRNWKELCTKLNIDTTLSREAREEAIILAQKVIIMSARPGRIKEIVDINIPYPRTQETKMAPEFLELKNHIWGQVYQEYLEVRK